MPHGFPAFDPPFGHEAVFENQENHGNDARQNQVDFVLVDCDK